MSYETSDCCNAPIVDESIDVCSDCYEHCQVIENTDDEEELERTREDEAYDRASSNAGGLI